MWLISYTYYDEVLIFEAERDLYSKMFLRGM
ncbi:hypothetical protein VCR26J2_180051 [Vibrio coralliirubri]|nr:hypothetical protein VCR6J2_450042 [Vibrio coralliirubri]CDT52197.1 hypothetical protein VCR26J2_180051 [Vibrio coralliirubri]